MNLTKHELGALGERTVAKHCACPRCKRGGTLVRLPTNFRCADLICDFCGFLAQVKASAVSNIERLPVSIPGAAWGPQKARMEAAIYFPLYIVLFDEVGHAIYYLSADLQPPELFVERQPLSDTARKKGWQGFRYDLREVANRMVRLI